MLSPYFWDTIQGNLRGIAYKGLNLGLLRELLIAVPPVAEQRRIVTKVDELMTLCDRLEASLRSGEDRRSGLLEAILGEALRPPEERNKAA
jgi:type I restriction enzyme S subunit